MSSARNTLSPFLVLIAYCPVCGGKQQVRQAQAPERRRWHDCLGCRAEFEIGGIPARAITPATQRSRRGPDDRGRQTGTRGNALGGRRAATGKVSPVR